MSILSAIKSTFVRQPMPKASASKSFIVYGPQGCGKTTHAEELAKRFRLDTIIDDGTVSERRFKPMGVLYLTNERPHWVSTETRRCLSFDDAMRLAGLVSAR